jgi:hypothetical protein
MQRISGPPDIYGSRGIYMERENQTRAPKYAYIIENIHAESGSSKWKSFMVSTPICVQKASHC